MIVLINRPTPASDLRCREPEIGGSARETMPAEQREYGVGAQILAELGVHDMILLTNSHHNRSSGSKATASPSSVEDPIAIPE